MTIQNGGHASFSHYITNATYTITGSAGLTASTFSADWLEVVGGAQVNISLGGTLLCNRLDLYGGGGHVPTVVVDGLGSNSKLISGSSNVGYFGGAGVLTFQNSSTGNSITGTLGIADSGSSGSSGSLSITGGSTLMVGGDLTLANQDLSGQSGTLTINGAGSALTQSGSSTLTVGSLTNGTAAINIGTTNTGGTLTTGAGPLTINSTGTVNIGSGSNSGTLNVLGSLVMNGGTLNFNAGSLSYIGNLTVGAGGLLGSDLTLAANRQLTLSGTTTIDLSHTLTLSGGTLNTGSLAVNGTLAFNSGTLGITGAGGLTIGSGGLLGSTLVLNANQTLHVTNSLTINAGAKLIAVSAAGLSAGNLLNNGDLVAIDTALGGPLVNNSAVTLVGSVDFNGPVSGPGNFFGPGTAHFNAGLSPGASPAIVTFEGGATLGPANTLVMEVGGLTPGTQHDQLQVAGALALGGTLQVSLISGFSPALGNQFDILDWGTRSGTFASVQLPALGGSLIWNTSQLYNTGVLSVIDSNFLPGDIDRNGNVNVADVSAMMTALSDLSAYQSTHGPGGGGALSDQQLLEIADLHPDNLVNNLDLQGLIVLLANGGGSGGGSLTAVPEPSSVALFVVGSLAMLRFAVRGRETRAQQAKA
jgi:hypothetical protein